LHAFLCGTGVRGRLPAAYWKCLAAAYCIQAQGVFLMRSFTVFHPAAARAPASRTLTGAGLLAMCAALAANPAAAASFTISTPTTTPQTLGNGDSGTVTSAGTLTVSGSTVAVTVSGSNATLTNLGTINQTGTGRAIRDNTGVTNLVVINGSSTNSSALLQAADADVIQMNKTPASVRLDNYGTMTSLNASKGGAQAIDFNAILSGSNVVNNYGTGVIQARDADAIRTGVNGVVNNYGKIQSTVTTDTGSDGIDAQNNTGLSVNNYAGGQIIGARHGITGGAIDNTVNFTATISNGGSISGNNGSGINIDGFNAKELVTITNTGSITGNGVTGDGDGIDVDGLVNLNNSGTIKSLNSVSSTGVAQSEGVTVGGGTIVNSGTIEGDVASGNTNAVGRGITLAGVDTSGTPEPIYANSTVTNTGLIKGQSDSAIAVGGGASGFTVTINNNAGGTLQGGGTANAAVKTGADNDTINNAGTIDGSSSGKAIDLGAGNNALNVTGGSASILGDISGGTGGTNAMTVNPGAGNSFSYAGSISNFGTVQVQSGNVTLSGVSTYSGTTLLSGGRLTLNGANRLSSSSALSLSGGTLEITNAAGSDGQTFSSLSLLDNSTLDLHSTSITLSSLGTIAGGKSLSVLDFYAGLNGYSIRILGDQTSNASFQSLLSALNFNGNGTAYQYDGTYTSITATPVPGSLVLMLSGVGLLGGVARRRKQQAAA
jgi:hypothetical protein